MEHIKKRGLQQRKLEHFKLSQWQFHILQVVASGISTEEVCATLNLTKKTLKFHKTSIFKIMGVKSTPEAIVKFYAAKLKLLQSQVEALQVQIKVQQDKGLSLPLGLKL